MVCSMSRARCCRLSRSLSGREDIKSLLNMIPGMKKIMKDIDIDNTAFDKVEAIIRSMTPMERANPKLMNLSRKRRVARGSGQSLGEVNRFIKQFEGMRKMMHKMSNNPAIA